MCSAPWTVLACAWDLTCTGRHDLTRVVSCNGYFINPFTAGHHLEHTKMEGVTVSYALASVIKTGLAGSSFVPAMPRFFEADDAPGLSETLPFLSVR